MKDDSVVVMDMLEFDGFKENSLLVSLFVYVDDV